MLQMPHLPAGDANVLLTAASHMRKLGINNLPPKVPPGSRLGPGAIASSYTRPIRQGDYMIRLDTLCLHTSLVAKEPALRMARDAQQGIQRRVQFVIVEEVRHAAVPTPALQLRAPARCCLLSVSQTLRLLLRVSVKRTAATHVICTNVRSV
jgi:hypothetical protein